jgi:cytochrome b6
MSALSRASEWLRERLPVDADKLQELTNEPVPNHMKKWWFALGGTPAYLFVVQIVTGILLALYYQGSAAGAYESVEHITNVVPFGWFIRSLHKWAATLMIAAVILHQMRVFFTGAFRKPREINWLVGCALLVSSLVAGFTGYSLVFEQLSFWGATVGANIADSVPVVGHVMKRLLLAGDAYNAQTLPRFYVLHAAVMPALIILLVIIHIAIIRMQGVSELRFEGEKRSSEDEEGKSQHFSFYPDHLFTEIIMGLILMVVLSALAILFPAGLGPKANALVTPEVIKPEWFFYVAFRWLKLFSGSAAVLSMGFIMFMMLGWPFIDAAIRKRWKGSEATVWIGILGVIAIIGLTIWEAAVEH